MQFILGLVLGFMSLFQIADCKRYRIVVNDEILPYIDSSILQLTDFFSLDNFILDQIDDDNIQVGGYVTVIKSMDRSLPLVVQLRTQTFEKATWNESPYRFTLTDFCSDATNPNRLWYNISKLITKKVCPGTIGDIWEIELHTMNIVYDTATPLPALMWRVYLLWTQGVPGFETLKYGYGVQVMFTEL